MNLGHFRITNQYGGEEIWTLIKNRELQSLWEQGLMQSNTQLHNVPVTQRYGYNRMLLKLEHCQQAVVLSERVQEDTDSDQKQRGLRRFSRFSSCVEEALSHSLQ